MPQYSHLFPWARTEKGQWFFVPCINTEEVRLAGLNEALRQRIFGAKAYAAIKDGRCGVWFYL